MNTVHSQRKVV